jgi:threonine dehydrogenase-like Zn-dependent dehydrogenase
MSVEQWPEPTPKPGEVLLKVIAVGVCGSELEGYIGESAIRRPPLVMGHEFSADVAAVGEGVDGIRTGQRVTVNPLLSCGVCAACLAGEQQVCDRRQILGVHRQGAFAPLVAVPAINVYPLSPGVSELAAALVEPLACAVHAGDKGGLKLGERVAVIGGGSLGIAVIQYARMSGVRSVVVVDTHPGRRDVGRSVGADAAVDSREAEPAAKIRDALGGAPDITFDTVGRGVTRRLAVDALRYGGRAVLLGLHEPDFALDGNEFLRRELSLISAYTYTRRAFGRAVAAVESGAMNLDGWISEHPLDEGPEVFRNLVENPDARPKAILRP